ncbi:MAG: polyphosphate polymerase domain-containing protein [Butyrivibrio sp.]|nr:polyphosphate polymerase domain-containing protein [Butyrivibrio sp.]
MGNRFRNEQKYLLSKSDIAMLDTRLMGIMEKDPHLGDEASYLIRSIYFDDPQNSCLHEKEDGVGVRQKWRIRSYNCSDNVIHLECKKKIRDMTWKDSISITRSDLEDALNGSVQVSKEKEKLWNEFALLVITKRYRPVTIVQYERVPYIWAPSNVRITIDRNLSSSISFDSFFEKYLPARPVMPAGLDLLEVKYDTLLPDHLRHMLSLRNMRNTSFSKYELCRRLPMSAF